MWETPLDGGASTRARTHTNTHARTHTRQVGAEPVSASNISSQLLAIEVTDDVLDSTLLIFDNVFRPLLRDTSNDAVRVFFFFFFFFFFFLCCVGTRGF